MSFQNVRTSIRYDGSCKEQPFMLKWPILHRLLLKIHCINQCSMLKAVLYRCTSGYSALKQCQATINRFLGWIPIKLSGCKSLGDPSHYPGLPNNKYRHQQICQSRSQQSQIPIFHPRCQDLPREVAIRPQSKSLKLGHLGWIIRIWGCQAETSIDKSRSADGDTRCLVGLLHRGQICL